MLGDINHSLRDQMVTRGEITDLFTLLGMLTGTPMRPLAKPINYLHDVQQGQTSPSGPADFARGLVTGR